MVARGISGGSSPTRSWGWLLSLLVWFCGGTVALGGENSRSAPATVQAGCEPVTGFTAEPLLTDVLANSSKTADGDSGSPVFSEDGSKIAFVSQAGNLVAVGGLSSFLNIYLNDLTTGLNQLVSRSWNGLSGGNGNSSGPVISSSGRRILFTSHADNLVTNDFNGADDVFVVDLTAGKTVLVSVNDAGEQSANGPSLGLSVSADGRVVAFESSATNLVSSDPNSLMDVFVRDLDAGITTLASIPVSGPSGASGASDSPSLSRDGGWIVFGSTATNLTLPGPPKAGFRHIYARNLAASNTVWVSTNASSMWTNVFGANSVAFHCVNHAISSDGRYVAFKASPLSGTNLALILRHDVLSGQTDLIATNARPNLTLETDSTGPTISPDGLSVAYSATTNRVTWDVVVWNAASGVKSMFSGSGADPAASSPYGSVYPIEFSANGAGLLLVRDGPDFSGLSVADLLSAAETNRLAILSGDLLFPSLRRDAKSMVLATRSMLLTNDLNSSYDVHTFELDGQRLKAISSVGADTNSHPSLGSSSISLSVAPFSASGQVLAFSSNARIPSSGDTNEYFDAIVADLASGSFRVISSTQDGVLANAPSLDVAVSGDGRKAAFVSAATNLLSYVTNLAFYPANRYRQVYIKDLVSGATEMASVSVAGTAAGNGHSSAPILSPNGDWVAFTSLARTLVVNSYTTGTRLFLRDLRSATTFLVPIPVGFALAPSTFPVAFAGAAEESPRIAYLFTNQTTSSLYVYDHLTVANKLVSGVASLPVITPNGRFLTFQTRTDSPNEAALYDLSQLKRVPLAMVLNVGTNGSTLQRPSTSISSDGTRLAFVSSMALEPVGDRNLANDVYLYDSSSGTLELVSVTPSKSAANGPSDTPVVSPDGRLIAFRSYATDLVAGGSVGENLFVRDLALQTTWLIRTPTSDGLLTKNISAPLFSSDGTTLFFSLITDGRLPSRNLFSVRITPPCAGDTDGDGLDDAWELAYFGDLGRDGSGDYDGDGLSDRAELLAGTSPKDSASTLRLDIIQATAGDLYVLRWATVLNRAYQIESSPDLVAREWVAVSPVVFGTGQPATLSVDANSAPTAFYRLRVAPQ